MNENHLIIFVKNPVKGQVKTRLASDIGTEAALGVYLQLLELTRHVADQVACTRHVFYSNEIEDDHWDEDRFNKHTQEGVDLGERMKKAFETVFSLGAKKAVIIGSDCPQITPTIIEQAFSTIEDVDVAIGPAQDGGYYLLGMKKPQPFLFDGKQWSTASVFADTITDIANSGLTFFELPMLSDLDNASDLHLLDE